MPRRIPRLARSWRRIGTALTLLRQQTLHETGIDKPRGGPYNAAFAERVNKTKFATMEPVTRSNLLFLMEPENRIVLDVLLAKWSPDERARRTHPTTLVQAVPKELKPPKPAPAAKPSAAPVSPQKHAEALAEVERLTKELAAAKRQEPAKAAPAVAKAAPSSPSQEPATNSALLVWQSRGDTNTAQRGDWTYHIHTYRRDGIRQFSVSISHGYSLPDKFVDMPSLEQAKAHCAEHAARILPGCTGL